MPLILAATVKQEGPFWDPGQTAIKKDFPAELWFEID